SKHDELEAKFFEERATLELLYQKLYEPLYSKVKYICCPVMVEAKDASQFKEIVQHLTDQTPNFRVYSHLATAVAATAAAATAATEKNIYSYGHSHASPQVRIDSYSWKELAEWNRNR
ncbi:hypothetical protein Ccrd_024836, partial [Cynara cardunculus var. scolymus]